MLERRSAVAAALVALTIGFASGCSDGGWDEAESAVFTLVVPDTAWVGQPFVARVTGVCGGPPCGRFDGITVTHSSNEWVLRPMSWSKRHPTSDCPPRDFFFDETVSLTGLERGMARVRAVSYGHDVVDSVLVLP